jgi:glycosyl transferase family 25
MNHIDAILYINLSYRVDRNEHILQELHKICQDQTKIHRIDAIKKEEGALGCGLSHIKALEYALSHPEWKRILIVEDDFTFKDLTAEAIHFYLDELVSYDPQMDVGLLSYNHSFIRYNSTENIWVQRIHYSQTASSYLISQHYIPILLQNMKESTTDMQKNGKRHENCIDIHWSLLQPHGKWYAIFPAIGYQYENYSDIEKHHVAYGC